MLLILILFLTGCCAQDSATDVQSAAVPVLHVQNGFELTAAAADMLRTGSESVTAAIPAQLYPEAGLRIRDAVKENVLTGTLVDSVTWEKHGRLLEIRAVYETDRETVRARKEMLAAYAAEWAACAAAFPPEIRVLLAYDLLCRSCIYDETAESAGSAYGALICGRASCAGFAEGFALLLEAAGIPVMQIEGTVTQPEGITAHAWNLVQLDGVWYHADCTWDADADTYSHFLCDDTVMLQTHSWDRTAYPAAEGRAYSYAEIAEEMAARTFMPE